MLIDVRARSFGLTPAIQRHAEQRATTALERAKVVDGRAMVRLADINGDRGGVDKLCRISVRIPRFGLVTARAVDRNLYRAIDRACIRLGKSLKRRLSRRRTVSRHRPRPDHAMTARIGLA
jgi:ribosome-associated translation inhibitor RaiA